jgi:uncharacterized protein with PQ loop repeat
MLSTTLNWIGAILLIIGFILVVTAAVYSQSTSAVKNTIFWLVGSGVIVFIFGLILLFIGQINSKCPQPILPATYSDTLIAREII